MEGNFVFLSIQDRPQNVWLHETRKIDSKFRVGNGAISLRSLPAVKSIISHRQSSAPQENEDGRDLDFVPSRLQTSTIVRGFADFRYESSVHHKRLPYDDCARTDGVRIEAVRAICFKCPPFTFDADYGFWSALPLLVQSVDRFLRHLNIVVYLQHCFPFDIFVVQKSVLH